MQGKPDEGEASWWHHKRRKRSITHLLGSSRTWWAMVAMGKFAAKFSSPGTRAQPESLWTALCPRSAGRPWQWRPPDCWPGDISSQWLLDRQNAWPGRLQADSFGDVNNQRPDAEIPGRKSLSIKLWCNRNLST